MDVRFRLTKKDYIQFYKFIIARSIVKRRGPFVSTVLVLILVLTAEPKQWTTYFILVTASPLIIFAVLYSCLFLNWFVKFNQRLSVDRSVLEETILETSEKGLLFRSQSKTTLRDWGAIADIGLNEEFICLTLEKNINIPVPRAAFSSEKELFGFLDFIQGKIIGHKKQVVVQERYKGERPEYFLGLIGLFPLVGSVAGSFFIINGLFRYRDKWLTLIGVSGIAWNVGIYLYFAHLL